MYRFRFLDDAVVHHVAIDAGLVEQHVNEQDDGLVLHILVGYAPAFLLRTGCIWVRSTILIVMSSSSPAALTLNI